MDEWSPWPTGETHLAQSTIRNYQMELRLLSEFLCYGRYDWVDACEEEFGSGAHPVPICHERNTHLQWSQWSRNASLSARTSAVVRQRRFGLALAIT